MPNLDDSKKLDRIYTALLGDKDMNIKGLADQVNENTREIKKVKKKLVYTSGFIAGIFLVFKWVGSKILSLI